MKKSNNLINEIILIEDPNDKTNKVCLGTYQKALQLWGIPHKVISLNQISFEELAFCSVLVIEMIQKLTDDCINVLNKFLQHGGNLIIGGKLPTEQDGTIRQSLSKLLGFRTISIGENAENVIPVPIVSKFTDLIPWDRDDVLFFHNHLYTSCTGIDLQIIKNITSAEILAKQILIEPGDEEWKFTLSEDALITQNQPFLDGGKVIYAALPFGSVDQAKPMTASDGTIYPEMTQENHASLLLIKTMVSNLTSSTGGLLPQITLWPEGKRAAIALNGDVHEYPNLLHGNLRCEYSYIPKMKALLDKHGLQGKYTYCVVGRTFDFHPAVMKTIADEDIIGHPYDDLSYTVFNTPYEELIKDMAATLAAIQRNIPECKTFRYGWRNHGVTGHTNARQAIEDLGFLYASDYQISADIEWNWKKFPYRMITYVNYPMKTKKPNGSNYQFWELPYIQSDIDLLQRAERGYDTDERTFFHLPGEASRAWNYYVDRVITEEAFWNSIWHPWASLRTQQDQKEVETTLDYIQAQEDICFLSLTDLALWWDHRSKVKVNFERSNIGWSIDVTNPLEKSIKGLTLRISGAKCDEFLIIGSQLKLQNQNEDCLITFDLCEFETKQILLEVLP